MACRRRCHNQLMLLCGVLAFLASVQIVRVYPYKHGLGQSILSYVPCKAFGGSISFHNQGYRLFSADDTNEALNRSIGSDLSTDVYVEPSNQVPQYLQHEPVLLKEALDMLVIDPDGRYLDLTLGYGGHTEAILKLLSPKGVLVALDRDPESVYYTSKRLEQYVRSKQLVPVIGTFSNLNSVLESNNLPLKDYTGIIADLGISTHQLEDPKRGFAYNTDGPLDMRMSNPLYDPFNPRDDIVKPNLDTGNIAFKLINKGREQDIAYVLREYGEEPRAIIIARRIVEKRQRLGEIATTFQLRDIVLSCVRGNHKAGMKTLSRVFQALRIYVNNELDELAHLLDHAPSILNPKQGRFVVISYHSLEDRAVKHAFTGLQKLKTMSNDSYKVITKKCVTPTLEECTTNQKARSAKLRCLERSMAAP
uniref:S-adenosyl methyltransferase, putative n=1 Tax=Babesia bovis TaxID=5865 RepID=S6B577_BABBO|nr:S-adenosyl methyltransferase, putative [Babesia bovis]